YRQRGCYPHFSVSRVGGLPPSNQRGREQPSHSPAGSPSLLAAASATRRPGLTPDSRELTGSLPTQRRTSPCGVSMPASSSRSGFSLPLSRLHLLGHSLGTLRSLPSPQAIEHTSTGLLVLPTFDHLQRVLETQQTVECHLECHAYEYGLTRFIEVIRPREGILNLCRLQPDPVAENEGGFLLPQSATFPLVDQDADANGPVTKVILVRVQLLT